MVRKDKDSGDAGFARIVALSELPLTEGALHSLRIGGHVFFVAGGATPQTVYDSGRGNKGSVHTRSMCGSMVRILSRCVCVDGYVKIYVWITMEP